MLRKLTSMVLMVSVIAVGISGLMMIVLGSFEFQLQMHPVHKVFGVLMCVSAVFHAYFNISTIKSYLKINKIAILTGVLFTLLIFLTIMGMNKPLNQDVIKEIESNISKLAHKQ